MTRQPAFFFFFFFNDTATTEIYTLSLHDALPIYPSSGGLDHLGLGSVSSDQILPSLSPGINVLTIYPRYHSFYVFLLDEFWRRDRLRNRTAWMYFFRPRDFLFSVGVFLFDRPEPVKDIAAVGTQK